MVLALMGVAPPEVRLPALGLRYERSDSLRADEHRCQEVSGQFWADKRHASERSQRLWVRTG